MNCNDDFNIPYNNIYVKVKPFCESSDSYYKVYLFGKELKILSHKDEMGVQHWREFDKGETDLARELGRLIEEQQKL